MLGKWQYGLLIKKKFKKRRFLLMLLGKWEESGPFGRQVQAPPTNKHSRPRCLWERLAKIFTVDRHVSGVEVRCDSGGLLSSPIFSLFSLVKYKSVF